MKFLEDCDSPEVSRRTETGAQSLLAAGARISGMSLWSDHRPPCWRRGRAPRAGVWALEPHCLAPNPSPTASRLCSPG